MTPLLAAVDPWILAFSLITVIITVAMGFRSAKTSKTASDFFVAGRSVSVGWNASAISGEYLSAASFMGVAGMVMSVGYDALWYPVCYACGYLFLLLFIAGPLRRFGAYTIPDFAEGRYDSPVFRKIAVIFVMFIGFFYTMPQMKGAGTTLAYIFPGLPYWAGVVLVGAVITLNVALGGMKGITLVQAVQYWIKVFAISVPIFVLISVYGHYGKQLEVNRDTKSPASNLGLPTTQLPLDLDFYAVKPEFFESKIKREGDKFVKKLAEDSYVTGESTILGALCFVSKFSDKVVHSQVNAWGRSTSPELVQDSNLQRTGAELLRDSRVFLTNNGISLIDGETEIVAVRSELVEHVKPLYATGGVSAILSSAREKAQARSNIGKKFTVRQPVIFEKVVERDYKGDIASETKRLYERNVVEPLKGTRTVSEASDVSTRFNTITNSIDDVLKRLAGLNSASRLPGTIVFRTDELRGKVVTVGTNMFRQKFGQTLIEDWLTASGIVLVSDEFNVIKAIPAELVEFHGETAMPSATATPLVGRKPLPEKAPSDEKWISPFGTLTTKAAAKAGLKLEEQKPYSLLYTYSLIIALVCGTAGLPHILVRFYTNPNGIAAKRTTMWVMILIGVFYVFPPIFGVMGRNLLPELYSGVGAKGTDKIVLELPHILNERVPYLGSILSGITCAGAFAAFMSTFSGLLVSMTGALAHDVYGRILRPKSTPEQRMRMFKYAAVLIGGVAILLGMQVEALEINFMVGQAFAIAAASYFPLLFMSVWWRGMTQKGAAIGMLSGGLLALLGITLTSVSDIVLKSSQTNGTPNPLQGLEGFWIANPAIRIMCEQPAIWAVPLAITLMIVVSKLTSKEVPKDIRMKMLVLHAPEQLGLKQEYIQEHQGTPGH